MKKRSKKLNRRQYITIGVVLVFIGLGILSYDYFVSKKQQVYETIKLEISSIPVLIEESDGSTDEDLTEEKVDDTNPNVEEKYYIGKLEIPKLNLTKGFADKNSKENNVNKNILVVKTGDYPDKKNGNFIIASHSGNAWNSYFRNLYKLKIGDIANVYYKNNKYTYKITRIYQQPKTGRVRIYRNTNKNTLTLITCTKNNKSTQTIYILELTNKKAY